jgi:ATP synthase protein I
MSDGQRPPEEEDTNSALLEQVRRRAGSAQRWLRDGDPSLARQFAAVGVLGWIIVVPALLGVWLGRWLDRWLATGITFTAALLMFGILLGGWSAWRWMHER